MEPRDQAIPAGPPDDPEDWSDEQWLEWLEATDADPDSPADADEEPTTVLGRAVRSTGGQLLGQAMAGLSNAIYGEKDDEVVIVAEGTSEPGKDEPFVVHLDPDHPERSSVVFRHLAAPPD
jgi:hypothetical protein